MTYMYIVSSGTLDINQSSGLPWCCCLFFKQTYGRLACAV